MSQVQVSAKLRLSHCVLCRSGCGADSSGADQSSAEAESLCVVQTWLRGCPPRTASPSVKPLRPSNSIPHLQIRAALRLSHCVLCRSGCGAARPGWQVPHPQPAHVGHPGQKHDRHLGGAHCGPAPRLPLGELSDVWIWPEHSSVQQFIHYGAGMTKQTKAGFRKHASRTAHVGNPGQEHDRRLGGAHCGPAPVLPLGELSYFS